MHGFEWLYEKGYEWWFKCVKKTFFRKPFTFVICVYFIGTYANDFVVKIN